jgi:hypothetical protein
MAPPVEFDLTTQTLRVDLRTPMSPDEWSRLLDVVGREMSAEFELELVLDGPPNIPGGRALVGALFDALEARGVAVGKISSA